VKSWAEPPGKWHSRALELLEQFRLEAPAPLPMTAVTPAFPGLVRLAVALGYPISAADDADVQQRLGLIAAPPCKAGGKRSASAAATQTHVANLARTVLDAWTKTPALATELIMHFVVEGGDLAGRLRCLKDAGSPFPQVGDSLHPDSRFHYCASLLSIVIPRAVEAHVGSTAAVQIVKRQEVPVLLPAVQERVLEADSILTLLHSENAPGCFPALLRQQSSSECALSLGVRRWCSLPEWVQDMQPGAASIVASYRSALPPPHPAPAAACRGDDFLGAWPLLALITRWYSQHQAAVRQRKRVRPEDKTASQTLVSASAVTVVSDAAAPQTSQML